MRCFDLLRFHCPRSPLFPGPGIALLRRSLVPALIPAFVPALLAWAAIATPARAVEIPANGVYGQPDLNRIDAMMPNDRRVSVVKGLAATNQGLYLADAALNRVMFFPKGTFAATRVYGQPNFDGTAPNNGGLSAHSLYSPYGVAADNTGVYVADTYNNRVLHFPHDSAEADRVYGQPGFTTATANNGGVSASSLYLPEHVAVDPEGGLYISDSGNYRVLYYPPGETVASFVYGQPTFNTNYAGLGPDRIATPQGVAADLTGVYVVDVGAHRILYFPKGSKEATRLYGQPDYYSMSPNGLGMGPRGLMKPVGLALDENGLYVAEYLNSRVLFFPNGSTSAAVVYGQPDFNTLGLNQYGTSGLGFYVPWTASVDQDYVYASDFANRVLRFPKVLTPMPADVAFQTAPAGAVAGSPLGTQPVVVVRRSDGSPAADYNGPVTLRLKPGVGPACARLSGTTTVNAVNGVATFAGLSIDYPGDYQVQALALSLPVATTETITVSRPNGEYMPGDLNHDGRFDMADITLHLRATAGLETLP